MRGKGRKQERDQAETAPPHQGAGHFDVQPKHLYLTALVVRDEQFAYDTKGVSLRLMHDPSVDPPFVVVSSMPK
ncbi:hypothetical protein [Streptomyces kurssanovii]|uniref:Uncharacterized protein n=1 Tax=Streptomyces kurssanovii TaxID=67312 RepID=A0ABV3HMP8_9ACTN